MRKYIARIELSDTLSAQNTGLIGEKVFHDWFKSNFQGEQIFKQKADRDYQKIDFVDEKGFKYQVKATKERTFTFNCGLENLQEHLTSDIYIFIQIRKKVAYIETFHDKDYINENIKPSFRYGNCFCWAKDLQQNELDLK